MHACRWMSVCSATALTKRGNICYLPCVSLIFTCLCYVQNWLDSTVNSHSWQPATVVAISVHVFLKCAHGRVETRLVLQHSNYCLRLRPTKLHTFCVGYRDRGHVGGQQLWSITAGSRTAITIAAIWEPPPPCGVSVAIIDLSTFFLDRPKAGVWSVHACPMLSIWDTFGE